jgi:hypothetical protein
VTKLYEENMNEIDAPMVLQARQNYDVRLINYIINYKKNIGVAQLVEALRYKPERRGFDSRWCHWSFSVT